MAQCRFVHRLFVTDRGMTPVKPARRNKDGFSSRLFPAQK